MALLIDPRTGDKWDFPDANVAAARERFGVVSPDEYAQQQLQQEHGGFGEQLKTVAEGAGTELAGLVGGFAASPGLPGAPTAPPVSPAAVQAELAPSSPEAQARAEANPIAHGIGKAVGDLPIYAALGGAAATAGGAAAGALGASEALGAGAGLLTESAATGTLQAAQDAAEGGPPLSAENVAKNGLINLALGSLIPAAGAGYRALFGDTRPLQAAVGESVQRAARAGENLADPEVAAEAGAQLDSKIGDAVAKLQSSAADSKAPVAKNLQAQRDALLTASENLRAQAPEVAQSLEDAASLPARRSYQALRDLATGDHGPDVSEALDGLVQDRAIWGDKAVEHHNAVLAVSAAGDDPAKLSEAVRGLDDESTQRVAQELDQYLEDKGRLAGAQAFGEPSSTVGAAHESFSDTDYETAIKDISDGKYENTALLAQEAPGLRNLASKDFAGSLDRINEVVNDDLSTLTKYDDYAEGAQSWSQAAISRQNKWIAKQTEELQQASARIGEASASGKYPLKGLGTKAQEIIDSGLKRIEDAPEGGARMAAVDNLKKRLQSYVMLAGRNSAAIDQQSRQFAMSVIEPVQEKIRLGLEDASLWGKRLSNLQRDTNAAWHGSLKAIQLIQDQLTEKVGQVYGVTGPQAIERAADSAAIERMLAHPEGGGTRLKNALDTALQGYDDLAAARQRNGFTKLGRIDEFRADLQNLRKQYDFASVLRTAETEAPQGEHVSGGAAMAANVALHGAEFVARAHGLPIGNAARQMGALGKMARFVDQKVKPALGFKPSELVRGPENAVDRVLATHLTGFRNLEELQDPSYTRNVLGEKTRAALKAAGGAVAGGAGVIGASLANEDQAHAAYLEGDSRRDTAATARALTDPASASEYARRAASTPSTLEQFQGEHATIQQAFQAQSAAVQRMMRDPEGTIDSLSSAFGAVEPALRDALASKSFEVATYLNGQLPPQRGVSVTRPNGLPPSSLEARSYALKFMAALKPSTAFDDAKRGTLRHEQVQTLQALWPELYSDLSSQTLEAMGQGRSTIVQRQRADLLFGFGAAIDPAFSPAITAAAAQGRAARAKQSPAPSSAPVTNKSTAALTPGGLDALGAGPR